MVFHSLSDLHWTNTSFQKRKMEGKKVESNQKSSIVNRHKCHCFSRFFIFIPYYPFHYYGLVNNQTDHAKNRTNMKISKRKTKNLTHKFVELLSIRSTFDTNLWKIVWIQNIICIKKPSNIIISHV